MTTQGLLFLSIVTDLPVLFTSAVTIPTDLMDLESGRRDVVLTAALGEFVTRGYDTASTNVIAREAGISKA